MNYKISNIGQIRNIKKRRILEPSQHRDGYLQVDLYHKNVRKTYKVHRIVAREFIDNPDNKSEVDHIDNNQK